jgi:branched-chain amino acid transport system ATP-binding protein
MLELVNVHTYYGENHVLKGVSLEVAKGSVSSLLGRNGMGKTTTIRSIIGFNRPRSGVVRFQGEEVSGFPAYQICQKGLGLVPQGRRIFPSLSVKENLTLGARRSIKYCAWSLDKMYSLFPVLKLRAELKGNLLSGGEQQMLSIARALLTDPQCLLMDEPSEGLAPMVIQEVGGVISQLKHEGLSVLLVEQNLPLALSVSDYAYIISKGEIVHGSTSEELANNTEIQGRYLAIKVDAGSYADVLCGEIPGMPIGTKT